MWEDDQRQSRPLKATDILIVAPYNAQVSDLLTRMPQARIGTVDKFQGQEAPVVIYSLTTSSPEDAPRGMEFLYSLNRLNVATDWLYRTNDDFIFCPWQLFEDAFSGRKHNHLFC